MDKELGKRIKSKRKKERLSAEDLAVKLGATAATNVYKWESGSVPEDPVLHQKLMDWLDGIENSHRQEVDIKSIMTLQNTLLQTQNRILAEIKDGIQVKIDKIDTNLDGAMVGMDTLQMEVKSARQVILKSLARIERPKGREDALLQEADNIMQNMRGSVGKKGIQG